MLRLLSLASLYCPSMTLEDFFTAKELPDANFSQLLGAFPRRLKLQMELQDTSWHPLFWKNLEWCEKNQIEILFPTHPHYPMSLLDLECPPLFLSLLGSPCWVDHVCLAVVGSRNPTTPSLRWMDQYLGPVLQQMQVVTVSGGARGIDQKAHAVSLRHEVPTVVLLPSGLRNFYPKELELWRQHVIDGGGCFLSQFAPEAIMWKSHFRERNRLIAQMAHALFVVEASRRSGSIMTAHLAMEREKPVCILPGHPTEPTALGALDLLTEGAIPIRDGGDLQVMLETRRTCAQP